jgi:hypothetical protein
MGLFSKIAKVAAPAMQIGGMVTGQPWLSAAGQALGQYGASKQLAQQAGETAAQYNARMQQLGQQGIFRPVGTKTLYGQSQFEVDPQTGQLKSASYQASPEVIAQQQRLGALMGQGLTAAEQAQQYMPQFQQAAGGLLGLGQQFLPTSTAPQLTAAEQEYLSGVQGLGRQLYGTGTGPSADVLAQQERLQGFAGQLMPSSDLTAAEQAYLGRTGAAAENILGGMSTQAAADVARQQGRLEQLAGQVTPTAYDPTAAARSYYEEQQALLEPGRQREEQRLGASVFGRGRAGLSVGAQGQPELFALSQARAEEDARLAAQARERGRTELREDIGLGTTLGGQALAAGQAGRQEQLGLTSTGLNLMGAQQTAEEAARQRMLQNMGLSAQFGGQAIQTGQAGQQYAQQQALQGLNLLGAAMSPEEQARQRMLQNIQTGAGLFGTAGGVLGTGYNVMSGALSPYQTALGQQTALESIAERPMQLGIQLGQAAMPGSQYAANMASGGAYGQAQQQIAGAEQKYNTLSGLLSNKKLMGDIGTGLGKVGDYLSNVFTPGGGIGGGITGSSIGVPFGQRVVTR